MSDTQFTVTDEAVAKGRTFGIYGDTASRIQRMAKRAARITHDRGNRRFQDYVLAIENNMVTDINLLD